MRTIKIPFTVDGLDEAIKQIDAYKQELNAKCELLAKRIGDIVFSSANNGFGNALADDVMTPGGRRESNVTVSLEGSGNLLVVIASGSDAVFIEFGAGVFHNGGKGMIGQSPHPWVEEKQLPYTIGTYDKGYGKKDVWGFTDDDKNLFLTHGTPAAMPLYHAVQEAKALIPDLAREVFSA